MERASLQAQSVLYQNEKRSLEKAAEYLANALRYERRTAGRLGQASLLWGDASPKPLFTETEIGALRLRPEIRVCEDLLFLCQILTRCQQAFCWPRPLYHYRIHGASAARNIRARLGSETLAREEILTLAPEGCCWEAAVFSYVQQGWLNVLRARRVGDGQAEARLRDALKPYLAGALTAGSIPAAQRLKLAAKLLFPRLVSEKYL